MIADSTHHRIVVTDLEEAGILTRSREGRRNRYAINSSERLRQAYRLAHPRA